MTPMVLGRPKEDTTTMCHRMLLALHPSISIPIHQLKAIIAEHIMKIHITPAVNICSTPRQIFSGQSEMGVNGHHNSPVDLQC